MLDVDQQYTECLNALHRTGILAKSNENSVSDATGKAYPAPTLEQTKELFARNEELVQKKLAQGFDRLVMTPLAMPLPDLFNVLKAGLRKHDAGKKIFQTRRQASDTPIPLYVNKEKQLWIWETLWDVVEKETLIYFPKEYSARHGGQSKSQVMHNAEICAVPGWSVGLAETLPVIPAKESAITRSGRKQLTVGYSPDQYLKILQTEPYKGESGKTLEDFIVEFLIRLDASNEVSHDVEDHNALWCLAQYMPINHEDFVPSGRWFRKVGRLRLDMHRTNNQQCLPSWGISTIVRMA